MSLNSSDGGYGGGMGGGSNDAPPRLDAHPDVPCYDVNAVVDQLGVRLMTLWSWEKMFGIPHLPRTPEDETGPTKRYSERDMQALRWLRDRIVDGVSPADAAARLVAAQGPTWAAERERASGRPTARPGLNTRPLHYSEFAAAPRPAPATRQLSSQELGYFSNSDEFNSIFPNPDASGSHRAPGHASGVPPTPPQQGNVTRVLGYPSNPNFAGRASNPSGPLMGYSSGGVGIGPTSGRLGMGGNTGQFTSGPLHAAPHAPPPGWGPSSHSASARELRPMLPQLLRAFATFDTLTANQVVGEALSRRPVETVCVALLLPALTRVRDLWARRQMSNPEEHFATNYVRAFLFSIFHTTTERFEAPLVIVSCAPRELHDVDALTLAVFWRRTGARVVFLGQDVDGDELVEEARERRPALVAICISDTKRIRALARIGRNLAALPAPRPIFGYTGSIFTRNAELHRKINGLFLGEDAGIATWHLRQMVHLDRGAPGAMQ